MVLKVADLHPNDGQLEAIGVHANPRIITDEEYRKLVKSLREDNLTGVLQEKVINYNGEWIVLDGNMRLRALREVGIEEVQCLVVPEDADAKTIEKIIILSNSTFGQWDMDALANWNAPLADWGVELPDSVSADEFGTEFNLPEGEKQPFQQITFSLADAQADALKQAVEDAKHLEEYKHQDTFGNTNSNGNAIALIVQQWADARK